MRSVSPHLRALPLLPLLVFWAACGSGSNDAPTAPVTLSHGPFEIVTQSRRISAGGFPNTSSNPFRTQAITEFVVRYQGAPVAITIGNEQVKEFWRVLRLADAPQPALLLSTTDFHLLKEDDGKLRIVSFGTPSTNYAELQWLDANQGQPGVVQGFGIESVDPVTGTELRGGRWLMLSNHTVLDVHKLKSYPVRPQIVSGTDAPMAGLSGGGSVRAFSPGQTQFVKAGSGRSDGEFYEALLVVDIPSGDAYALPIDKHTRYISSDDVTPAWLDHYFQWSRDANGKERLEPRTGVTPMPWHGKWVDFGGDLLEYRLPGANPGMVPVLREFILQRMGGKPAPDWMDEQKPSDRTFAVTDCDGVIVLSSNDEGVGVFVAGTSTTPSPHCAPAIRRIGEAFEQELMAGKHQNLFPDE